MTDLIGCKKCGSFSGDDWGQCGISCPMPMSPHYDPAALQSTPDPTAEIRALERRLRATAEGWKAAAKSHDAAEERAVAAEAREMALLVLLDNLVIAHSDRKRHPDAANDAAQEARAYLYTDGPDAK